jgi:hypothetical protein
MLLFVAAAYGGVACSSPACDEAAARLEACLAKLNCNETDPLQRPECDQARTSGQEAVKQLRDAPCVDAVADTARKYMACQVDPANFCKCS